MIIVVMLVLEGTKALQRPKALVFIKNGIEIRSAIKLIITPIKIDVRDNKIAAITPAATVLIAVIVFIKCRIRVPEQYNTSDCAECW